MTEISGLININKPAGVTSFWVVKQVKRILGIKKVGHCGTLDPLADGVLVILYGKATKLQDRLMSDEKLYRTTLKLGLTTDTADITGKTLKTAPVKTFNKAEIEAVLSGFMGEIEQVPPMYSAIKYGGTRLYKFAREGREVVREPRKITIKNIELLRYGPETLELRIECSKGTYIRTLGEDIGIKLGCGAAVQSLCRERSGQFSLETSLDGRKLQAMGREELLNSCKDAGTFVPGAGAQI